jgi:heme/copper-type cytochrome/quinol oxidase subunit 4
MEFLILGGLILIMDLLKKVNKKLENSVKALSALKIPIGIVVILTSIGFWGAHGAAGTLQGIVGIVAGAVLILDLLLLLPINKETEKQLENLMTVLAVPVGIAAIIVGIAGLFYR